MLRCKVSIFEQMKSSLKSIIVLSVLGILIGCKKAKITNSCESNTVEVSPSDFNGDSAVFFIPTAFTPNGDGLNDLFRPIIGGIDISSFEVCKRNKVLFMADDENPSWDGTDTDGDMCKDGVYNYLIKGSNPTDGNFEITGEVSLLTEAELLCSPCRFEDQIDPAYGFLYPTAETCDGH